MGIHVWAPIVLAFLSVIMAVIGICRKIKKKNYKKVLLLSIIFLFTGVVIFLSPVIIMLIFNTGVGPGVYDTVG